MASKAWMKTINIALGVDTTSLDKGLRSAKEKVLETTQAAKALQGALKWDTSDNAIVSAQEAAQEAVKATTEQVDILKTAIKKVSEDGGADAPKHIKLLNAQLVSAQNEAKKATDRLNDVAGAQFKNNLSQANSSIELTQRKVTALSASLDMEWDNNTFKNAQAEAQIAVTQTNDKLTLLRKELIRLEGEVTTGKTKGEFEQLSAELEETKLKAKQAEQQLSQINQLKLDRVTDTLNQAGNAMMRSGAVMTAGVTLPLAYIGKQALDTASQLSEVQNVVDQSFKENAESVNEWSKSLLESNGISELTAKQYAGLFKSMSNGMGIADEAGIEMSKTLTELIPDIASYFNISNEVAGTKLKSIFTGETESLKEIGVVMTEANVNAFALSQGMEQLSDDMTQQEKVNLRYKFVLDTLKDAQGDFGRTLETSLANQTRLAEEQFKTLSATLAEELLPIATDILKWANDVLKSFNQMDESTKKTTLVIIGLATSLGPATTLVGSLIKTVSGGISVFNKITSAMAAHKVATDAAAVSQGTLNVAMLASPTALIIAGVAAVAGTLLIYNNTINDATAKTRELNEKLKETVNTYEQVSTASQSNINKTEAEMSIADGLISRYEELNGKVNKTSEEKTELAAIVQKLNELLGITIDLSNNEAGIYDMTAASLRNLTQARRDEVNAIALKNKAIASSEMLMDLDEQEKEARKNVEDWQEKKTNGDYAYFAPKNLFGDDKLVEAEDALNDILAQKAKAKSEIEAYANYKPPVYQDSSYIRSDPLSEYANARNSALKPKTTPIDKSAKREKEELDYQQSLGKKTQEQYTTELKAIKQKYYLDSSGMASAESEFERSLNISIYNQELSLAKKATAAKTNYTKESEIARTKLLKESYEEQKKTAKEAYDLNKKLIKDSYDVEKKEITETNKARKETLDKRYKDEVSAIDEAYKAKEALINQQIKAIDDEIAARRRLKEESEQDNSINAVKAQLAYGKLDEFSKLELEAELKRLEDEKGERAWENEQENRKNSLSQELEDAKAMAEQQKQTAADLYAQRKDALQAEYDLANARLEESYALSIDNLDKQYKVHTEQLEAMFATSSTQMGKISNDFVATITKGCREAANILANASEQVKAANFAARQAPNVANNYNTTNRTANLHVAQGYSEYQVRQIVEKILY